MFDISALLFECYPDIDNVKLQGVLNDDELPLFTVNNGDVGLCLAMDDDYCEYVIVHSYTFAYSATTWIGKLQRRLMPC